LRIRDPHTYRSGQGEHSGEPAQEFVEELKPADLGQASWDAFRGPYELTVRRVSPPAAKGHAQMVAGKVADQAKSIAQLLREKGFYRG
jgi:electron transfer flavoprotein alpha/beta subunit